MSTKRHGLRVDITTPVEETAAAINELLAAGWALVSVSAMDMGNQFGFCFERSDA